LNGQVQHGWKLPPLKTVVVNEMERTRRTGVVGRDKKRRIHFLRLFGGKSERSQKSLLRREALESRKEHKPKTALSIWRPPWALSFDGRTISRAAETRRIRHENVKLGEKHFRCQESSSAPSLPIAAFDTFSVSNGAESYYPPRAFRGSLRV